MQPAHRIYSLPPREGAQSLARCAFCPARTHAPCGAIHDAAGLADLENAHAPLRRIPSGLPLFQQGAPSDRSYTILRGWVALTRTSRDGGLSILRFVLPGDVLAFERRSGVSTCGALAVGDVTVCSFSRARQERLELDHPRYGARHRAAQDGALEQAQEALVSIMRRSALERVANLLLQLSWRSLRRAPVCGDQIEAPLTQIQMGLATGLTAVHVSRTMRQLREDGLVTFENHCLTIHDAAALERLAGAAPEVTALWA
jgi:CRP/FNR family transcriptional regulator